MLIQELGHESLDQGIPPEEAAKIVAAKLSENEHHSRMWYRINATRNMSGGKKLTPQVFSAFKDVRYNYPLSLHYYVIIIITVNSYYYYNLNIKKKQYATKFSRSPTSISQISNTSKV